MLRDGAVFKLLDRSTVRRLPIGDTADCQSALQRWRIGNCSLIATVCHLFPHFSQKNIFGVRTGAEMGAGREKPESAKRWLKLLKVAKRCVWKFFLNMMTVSKNRQVPQTKARGVNLNADAPAGEARSRLVSLNLRWSRLLNIFFLF
jgi:hypothetical protein